MLLGQVIGSSVAAGQENTISALIAHLGPASAERPQEPVVSINPRGLITLTRPGVTAVLIIIARIPGAAYALDLHSIRPVTFNESTSQSRLYRNRTVRECIRVDFRATKVRRIAAMASAAAVMIFAGIVIVGRRSRNNPLPNQY